MVLTIDVTGFLCVFLVKSLHEICMWEVEWQPWTFGMWTPLWGAGDIDFQQPTTM
jgi:hypothetical protein